MATILSNRASLTAWRVNTGKFTPWCRADQSVNFRAFGLGPNLIAEFVIAVVDQVRPFLSLGPEVFLNAIKCTSKTLIIRSPRDLGLCTITWEPVPYFCLGGRGVQ